LSPDTDCTTPGKRRHRPGARHLACCREVLPRPAAVGYTKLTGHAALAASALDIGTGLMAGSISTGSHDGDSLGPARPWDR